MKYNKIVGGITIQIDTKRLDANIREAPSQKSVMSGRKKPRMQRRITMQRLQHVKRMICLRKHLKV